jgi:catechol 2,3-dioxygenase-like lactoylglutathione lyase family enzyme
MKSKFHISLNVNNLEQAVRFYTALLNAPPAKLKPGYAKFDLDEPSINLALEEAPVTSITGLTHGGIRVTGIEQVLAAKLRLEEAGFKTLDEMGVNCCYAFQDKIWVADPSGYRWEVYILKEDTDEAGHSDAARQISSAQQDCCSKSESAAQQEPCCAGLTPAMVSVAKTIGCCDTSAKSA